MSAAAACCSYPAGDCIGTSSFNGSCRTVPFTGTTADRRDAADERELSDPLLPISFPGVSVCLPPSVLLPLDLEVDLLTGCTSDRWCAVHVDELVHLVGFSGDVGTDHTLAFSGRHCGWKVDLLQTSNDPDDALAFEGRHACGGRVLLEVSM